MRILVCGGRDCKDEELVWHGINHYRDSTFLSDPDDWIIAGAARGVDSFAADYARTYGLRLKEYPADWATYGRKAGYIRNQQMLVQGNPDVILAFPGGKGTKMMVDLAIKAGKPVRYMGRDPLGNIVMGTLGPSSQATIPSPEPGIKTKLFQQKYIDRIAALQMLTPGQRDGIYQEVACEEMLFFKSQDQAVMEYEEIQNVQELMDKLKNADPS